MSKLPKGPYCYVPGTLNYFPCVQFPLLKGSTRPREICINEPMGSTLAEFEALAQFIAEGPAVLRLAIDAMKDARKKLHWYRDRCPGACPYPLGLEALEAAITAGEALL